MKDTRKRQQEEKSSYIGIEKYRKKRRKKRRLKVFAIVCAVVAVCLCGYVLRDPILSVLYDAVGFIGSIGAEKVTFPIQQTASQKTRLASMKREIVVYDDLFVHIYGKNGKVFQSIQHGMANPAVETSSSQVLTYSIGGYDIRLDSKYSNIYEKNLPQQILSASLGANGDTAVVTKSDIYASTLTVYDSKGEERYVWEQLDNLILDASLSPSGKFCAAASVVPEGAQVTTRVSVLDGSGKVSGTVNVKGAMVIEMTFDASGNLMVVTEEAVTLLRVTDAGEPERIAEETYSGTVSQAFIESGQFGGVVVSDAFNGAKCDLIVMDYEGKVIRTELPRPVTGLDTEEDFIYILDDKAITVYDKKGQELSTTDLQQNYLQLEKNAGGLYLLSPTHLERYQKQYSPTSSDSEA